MSRKDYIEIAELFKTTRALNYLETATEIEQYISRIERGLMDIFIADNP